MILTVIFLTLLLTKIFGVLHLSWWVVASILLVIAGLKAFKYIALLTVMILAGIAEAKK